jgi:hypothetical protein
VFVSSPNNIPFDDFSRILLVNSPRKGEEAFEKGIDISIDFHDQELIVLGCLFSVRQQEKISFYSFSIGFARNEKITFAKSNFISKHIRSFAFSFE